MRLWLIAKIVLHPAQSLQERIDKWVMARVKREPGPISISRRRVYIVPTRFGYLYGFMLVVMLFGAMNYNNSMAFFLTFLLGGLGLVCMHHTHGNLVNLNLHAGKTTPVFAGEIAHFQVLVENPAAAPRYSLALSWPQYTVAQVALDAEGKPVKGRRRVAWDATTVNADVAASSSTLMSITLPAPQRGWLPARVFSISTDFPLGLFHAWTWAELEMTCLIYPHPAAAGLEPPTSAGSGGHSTGGRSGQDEFAGLRNYQQGDTPRSIHWKSLPKLQNPMVKQFSETLERELWLEWNALTGLDAEARLSQLTRWVLDLEADNVAYGLRLPGAIIKPSRGELHQHQCLKTLALYRV
jgi:uncharacterized protein (DUF58 family)